jgi:hypothetical protein
VPQREAVLELLRAELPDWPAAYAAWLPNETHARLLGKVAVALVRGGGGKLVATFLDEVFLHPQRLPAAFVWACEAVAEEGLAGLLADRVSGALLIRLVDLAERREFGPLRARLKEILSARGLAGAIVQQHLSEEQGKRLLQMLERPGQLADERAWVRRAVAMRFPSCSRRRRARRCRLSRRPWCGCSRTSRTCSSARFPRRSRRSRSPGSTAT